MVQCYRVISCNAPLKQHILESHLNLFTEQLSSINDEEGGKFQPNTSRF